MSAGLIFTDHSAYGVSVTARSVPTAVRRNVAVPGAVETPAFCSAALGVEDKVADQPQGDPSGVGDCVPHAAPAVIDLLDLLKQ